MVTESQRMSQEQPTGQSRGHGMVAAVAAKHPKEDWDEIPMLPPRPTNGGQTIDQTASTEGDGIQESELLMQTGDGEASTQIEPGADPKGLGWVDSTWARTIAGVWLDPMFG